MYVFSCKHVGTQSIDSPTVLSFWGITRLFSDYLETAETLQVYLVHHYVVIKQLNEILFTRVIYNYGNTIFFSAMHYHVCMCTE